LLVLGGERTYRERVGSPHTDDAPLFGFKTPGGHGTVEHAVGG
jgi:hypothetical protein